MNIALVSIGALRNSREATRITILSLAQELIRQGHTAVVICKKAKGYLDYEKIGDVSLYRFSFPILSKLFFPVKGIRFLEKKIGRTFDIIHGFSSTPLFVLSAALAGVSSPQAKIIHTLRSYSRAIGGNRFSSVLRLADKVTVPSKVFAVKLKGIPRDRVEIVPSWIDLATFRPQNKQQLKKKYGYEGKKVVFHYGAMWPNKGTDYLIQAIPQLVEKDKNVLFIFAPRYAAITNLQQQVTALQIEKYVRFITTEIKVEEYVTLADVVVLPYVNLLGTEGNPSCLLEAMACKTAVVTSDLPELRELADDTAWMALPADVDSLVEQIRLALYWPSPEKIEKAYQKISQFSVQKVSSQFIQLYYALNSPSPLSSKNQSPPGKTSQNHYQACTLPPLRSDNLPAKVEGERVNFDFGPNYPFS